MPGRDGTGPFGRGALTGRGMGFCVVKLPDESSPASQEDATQTGQETEIFRETGEGVIAMPAGDGTGPMGQGPMTGRAAGYCAGFPVPGYMSLVGGRTLGARPVSASYARAPHAGAIVPYGYPTAYAPTWPRALGWFGRGFGRGRGRGFGPGGGRGRRWFGW